MASTHIGDLDAKPFKPRPKKLSVPATVDDDILTLLHGSDPVRVELTRLENELREKDRELGEALAEIKSLRNSERLKEKGVEELTDELNKVDEKLKATEALLESKNLEIKRINDEKKAALAAQFAAEATLRRVHAAQKDDEMPPIEAIIAPLEAELKLVKMEVAKLQDDNRALDRLTKSKEAALLEAERTVQIAMAKASLVDDLQNKNQELMKQIEICQEENKILDKMHRQKVAEVEKLTQTVHELEEAVLAGGAAANAVRDYQRKVQEMNEERKVLEREVARAKVTANRVATVVANDWKDANDKVMPVWQFGHLMLPPPASPLLRQVFLTQEKYQLRLKVLEERFKAPNGNSKITASNGRSIATGPSRRQSFGGAESLSTSSSNGYLSRKNLSSKSESLRSNSANVLLKYAKLADANGLDDMPTSTNDQTITSETITTHEESANGTLTEKSKAEHEDYVSGTLYDMLQKEVISLRKACHEKDQNLKSKDDAIEMLAKKVDTLNKAMEVEARRMRREVASMEKEVAAMRVNKEHDHRTRRASAPRGAVNSQSISASPNIWYSSEAGSGVHVTSRQIHLAVPVSMCKDDQTKKVSL
ncbi:Microtubule-associated protein 70 [Sesbania bispinosa]|nr:Microtubule-associated protein 70 [Sesbania bispinosa]